jgi:hypothetical protein
VRDLRAIAPRYLRKQRKNIIDPKAVSPDSFFVLAPLLGFVLNVIGQVAVREQLARQRAERERAREREREVDAYDKSKSEWPSALDRFHRRS